MRIVEADNVKKVDFDKEKQDRQEGRSRLTLSQWGKLYFDEMIKPDKPSRDWQQRMFKKVEPRMGGMFLDEIDEEVIDEYRDTRTREPVTKHKKPLKGTRVSFSTVNRELAILRLLLRLRIGFLNTFFMAGAIAQDRESCQFAFVLDEKPTVVPVGSTGERSEGREVLRIAPLARTQSERLRRLALAGGFRLSDWAMFGQDPPTYLRSTTATRCPRPAKVQASSFEPAPLPKMRRS